MSLEKVGALEERITKVVDLVRNLKEENTRLEAVVSRMQGELESMKALEGEAARLREEKEEVRERLEKILKGIEGLTL